MAKNYSGKTATYKALIGAMKEAMKECEEPTEAQKKTILEMLGPLAAHVSAPACESESDSDGSDSESDDDECDGGSCKRSYKPGPRAKGRRLYKKNGGTEEKWRAKSDKYKDKYYERHA